MSGMEFLHYCLFAFAWIGHACIWTSLLSYLFGLTLPKGLLKVWRLLTGFIILAFPLLLLSFDTSSWFNTDERNPWVVYARVCLGFGAIIFPLITFKRALRKQPVCVVSEQTRTLDLWPELGEKLIGDGKGRAITRLPGNCVFKFDMTELTLALPDLPPAWDGLTLLVVSDLHFHGTPSRAYFDRVFDELTTGPVPDVVCLLGDYVDTDTHREWIRPLLGRLRAKEVKLAILGNHDKDHDPERIRDELTATGCTMLSNTWREVTVRGVNFVAVGHEGPWFKPTPDLSAAAEGTFRLCLSHTPDNFYWGVAHNIDLMLSGHVHGGGIRLPVIGSIFVPSVYGRRFDYGVFERNGTAMLVNRGISGKEPLRIRCNPQAMRLTLKRQNEPEA